MAKGWHRESRRHSMARRGIKTAQKFNISSMPNLKMSERVYKLRRRVIGIINEAKQIDKNLPRINVRITEKNKIKPSVLGKGSMTNDVVIWIPEATFNLSDNDLRYVVYHEIAHTVYGLHHDGGIMGSTINKGLSKNQIEKLFLKAIKK